jgi:hypothetical protein
VHLDLSHHTSSFHLTVGPLREHSLQAKYGLTLKTILESNLGLETQPNKYNKKSAASLGEMEPN